MRLSIFMLLFALHLSCLANIYCSEPRWLLVRDIPSPDAFVPDFGLRIAMHSGMGVASGFHFEEINDGSGALTQYGVTYMFSLEGDEPPQELQPVGTPPIYNDFVFTAISENRVLVGDDEDSYGTTGAAYLFDRTTGQQIARLTAPDGQVGRDAWFGYNVALTSDYAIVAPGHFREDGIYVFDSSDGQFIRKIAKTESSQSLSLAARENLVLVGKAEPWGNENVTCTTLIRAILCNRLPILTHHRTMNLASTLH